MSFKTFCDICNKEVDDSQNIHMWGLGGTMHYCKDCWTNKRFWPKIHKLPKEKQ